MDDRGESNDHIVVDDLTKTYRVHRRPRSFVANPRSVVRRRYYDTVEAVHDLSFRIERCEVVALL